MEFQIVQPLPRLKVFLQCFRVVFDLPVGGDGVGEQILTLKQGRNTAVQFTLAFRTLAAQTGWPDDPVKAAFSQGIEPGVAD